MQGVRATALGVGVALVLEQRAVIIADFISLSLILGETHFKASQIAQMQFVLWPQE